MLPEVLGSGVQPSRDDSGLDAISGFAGRLQQSGAIGVYRAEPFSLFTLAGCTGVPPGPLTRSLRRFG